jgi:peptidylprolyl isomerase
MLADLPPVNHCVEQRTLSFAARHVTARVDGKPFTHIEHKGKIVRLKLLPRGHHTLQLRADGKTVKRPYQTCIDTRPEIAKPAGDPPTTLQVTDLAKGSIRQAKRGHEVTVQYSSVAWSDGSAIDSSWDRKAEPFTFKLGSGQVIEGFDRGIRGMKVGGRRQVVIPPDLGYGDEGSGPIKPGETLVFVVDLVAIG